MEAGIRKPFGLRPEQSFQMNRSEQSLREGITFVPGDLETISGAVLICLWHRTSRYISSSISHITSVAERGVVASNISSSESPPGQPLSILGSPICGHRQQMVFSRKHIQLTSRAPTGSNNVNSSSLMSLPGDNSVVN